MVPFSHVLFAILAVIKDLIQNMNLVIGCTVGCILSVGSCRVIMLPEKGAQKQQHDGKHSTVDRRAALCSPVNPEDHISMDKEEGFS